MQWIPFWWIPWLISFSLWLIRMIQSGLSRMSQFRKKQELYRYFKISAQGSNIIKRFKSSIDVCFYFRGNWRKSLRHHKISWSPQTCQLVYHFGRLQIAPFVITSSQKQFGWDSLGILCLSTPFTLPSRPHPPPSIRRVNARAKVGTSSFNQDRDG